MAILQVSYFSNAMSREVTFNALIPMDMRENNQSDRQKPMKSLYLLNGYSGSHTDWISFTRIRELSEKYHLAVFMPAGENSFYVDEEDRRSNHGEYVGNELVAYTRQLFPISTKREDTFIGGLSMGGFGAIRNGLKYSENFSRIIALSSAIMTYKIKNAKPGFVDAGGGDYKYFTSVFGDLSKLEGSDNDPEALLRNLKQTNQPIPNIYLACGTEDFLLDVNHLFRDFLSHEGVDYTYVEGPGDHTWDFWDEYIEKALEWIYT